VQVKLLGSEQHSAGAHGHEDFSEIFVHQIIETIEFVLGSISNTASYLRLWALSLAHSQLAEVFFSMLMEGNIEKGGVGGAIGLIIKYYFFACVTFGVLLCMDVMECFLHALRLHWVEFQNKFYKADGFAFKPFSFSDALKESSEGLE
jgi:V-type H+-transporting ATPase subunit a